MIQAEYDAIAPTFSRSRKQQAWKEIEILVEMFWKHFPTSEIPRILDVGCGSWRLIPYLQKAFPQGFEYLWVDISSWMLHEARAAHPDFRFELADMREIQENTSVQTWMQSRGFKEFDGIFAIASFHHLITNSDRSKTLAGFRALLSPNGLLAMTNWNLLSLSNMSKYEKFQTPSGVFRIKIGSSVRSYWALSILNLRTILLHTGFEEIFSDENERNISNISRKMNSISPTAHSGSE